MILHVGDLPLDSAAERERAPFPRLGGLRPIGDAVMIALARLVDPAAPGSVAAPVSMGDPAPLDATRFDAAPLDAATQFCGAPCGV